MGTGIILPALTDHGYADVAWKLLMQDTYPGWGYWLKNGADCAWEAWELTTRSRDHYFLGTCDEFFYSHLCGIRALKDGCKNIEIKPVFLAGLTHAGTCMQTVRGELESAWKREEDGTVCLNVKVPYGATAKIHLPAGKIRIAKGQEGIAERRCSSAGAGGDGASVAVDVAAEQSRCGEIVLTAISGSYTIYIG